jgi:hypothetical protein
MTITIIEPTVADLTGAALDGSGVFDVLMRANKVHLESEFTKNRLKGSEYATVYLGSLQSVMTTALTFLLQKQKNALEAQLIEQQILLAKVEVTKAEASLLQIEAQTALVDQQRLNAIAELAIIQANALKVPAEIALINAQTGKIVDERAMLVAQIAKVNRDTINGAIEATVITAQKLKVDAEIILLGKSGTKSDQETALLLHKVATEVAQISASGVEANSVIGKQKILYTAQADGFARDAEQKAAKLMADTWSVRRTTDEGTQADGSNMLDNVNIGRAIAKMLTGIGA